MITNKKIICANCQTEDYHDIIFLAPPEWNKDFQYKCQHCESIHIFHYNESYDLVNNMHLYVGTVDKSFNWVFTNSEWGRSCGNQYVLDFYLKTLYDMQNQKIEMSKFVTKNKISNKPYNKQPILIFNSIVNGHFQECFRGIVRLKEHLLNTCSEQYYNILIMDDMTKICTAPLSKLDGLDEIWYVSDVDNYALLSKEITEIVSSYYSKTICISKKTGPTKHGVELIRNLLKLNDKKLLKSNKDQIQNKYIAITVRNDYIKGRAGLDNDKEISKICNMIKERGFVPIVVACTEAEARICEKIDSAEVFLTKNLEDQITFYSEHCCGMVGTNGSCCNIPSLYNIPMFILARYRQFPDDFYCFGRLISPYLENHPFHGELWKADNVWEYAIGMEEKTSIDKYKNEFNEWLYILDKNILCKE